MTQPRLDKDLLTDRELGKLPEGLFERRTAEIAALLKERVHRPGEGPRTAGWQEEIISREIPVGASVLDLGCGDGFLLERLVRERGVRGQGV